MTNVNAKIKGNATMTAKSGFCMEMLNQTAIANTNKATTETDPTITLTNFPAGTHSEYKMSFTSTIYMKKMSKFSLAVRL